MVHRCNFSTPWLACLVAQHYLCLEAYLFLHLHVLCVKGAYAATQACLLGDMANTCLMSK